MSDAPIFQIKRNGSGYLACVNVDRFGYHPYCRATTTEAGAEKLLDCLRRSLARNPGPVARTLEQWYRGEICERSGLSGVGRKRRKRSRK